MSERKQVIVDPATRGKPKSPPEDVYELTFSAVLDYGASKTGFNGAEPQEQFTLEFTLHYPFEEDPEDLEERGPLDGMKLKAWYTPKFTWWNTAFPQPKMNKLLQALTNNTYVEPNEAYDQWEELESLVGRRFRQLVGPNDKGWANLKGDPMPVRQAPKLKARVLPATPTHDADDVDESVTGAAA